MAVCFLLVRANTVKNTQNAVHKSQALSFHTIDRPTSHDCHCAQRLCLL